jgi:hypothetical protein
MLLRGYPGVRDRDPLASTGRTLLYAQSRRGLARQRHSNNFQASLDSSTPDSGRARQHALLLVVVVEREREREREKEVSRTEMRGKSASSGKP